MKKKGFTLMELLGVISVLALLSLIVAFPVTKFIKDANEKACKEQVNTILNAAKLWGSDNPGKLPEIGGTVSFPISQLINEGYLKEGIKNPKTKEAIDVTNTRVKISRTEKKRFEYTLSINICA